MKRLQKKGCRNSKGVTAIELTLTVLLLAVFTYLFVPRYHTAHIEKSRVYNIAHRMAEDVRLTRQRAISSGVNYAFQLYQTSGATNSYRVYKNSSGPGAAEVDIAPTQFATGTVTIGDIAGGSASGKLVFSNLGVLATPSGSGTATGVWMPVFNGEDFWSVHVNHSTGRALLKNTAWEISTSSTYSPDSVCFTAADTLYFRLRTKEITAPSVAKAYLRQGGTLKATINLSQSGNNFTGSQNLGACAGGCAVGALEVEIVIVEGSNRIDAEDNHREIKAACP